MIASMGLTFVRVALLASEGQFLVHPHLAFDFAGTRQSGLPKLHIGDFDRDYEALHRARIDAGKFGEQVDEALIRICLELHFGRKYRLLDV